MVLAFGIRVDLTHTGRPAGRVEWFVTSNPGGIRRHFDKPIYMRPRYLVAQATRFGHRRRPIWLAFRKGG